MQYELVDTKHNSLTVGQDSDVESTIVLFTKVFVSATRVFVNELIPTNTTPISSFAVRNDEQDKDEGITSSLFKKRSLSAGRCNIVPTVIIGNARIGCSRLLASFCFGGNITHIDLHIDVWY